MIEWALAVGVIVGLPIGAIALGVVFGRWLANRDLPLESTKIKKEDLKTGEAER